MVEDELTLRKAWQLMLGINPPEDLVCPLGESAVEIYPGDGDEIWLACNAKTWLDAVCAACLFNGVTYENHFTVTKPTGNGINHKTGYFKGW